MEITTLEPKVTTTLEENTTTLKPEEIEPELLSPEWATITQILYNLFDLVGIGLKIFCIILIKRRCDISHAVYNLMLQYLIFGIVLSVAWIIAGWFVSNPMLNNDYFFEWIFIQQMVEILPYDLYQVCWAAIAYLRYTAVKNGTNVDSKDLASFSTKFKVSCLVWLTWITSEIWKASVDLILPYYLPNSFGAFLGIVNERNHFLQRLIWIILLQFVQILVEVYAFTHYLMLTDLMKKTGAKPVENKWLARMEKRRMEKLSAAVSAIRVMSMVSVAENFVSLIWALTPLSLEQVKKNMNFQ